MEGNVVPTAVETFEVERKTVIVNWRCSESLVYCRKVSLVETKVLKEMVS